MPQIYENAFELVGNTPLLKLTRLGEKVGATANIIAKLEYLNPAGSVKDRVGLWLIKDAEEKGILTPDSVIIEPTSGNTGIGLASVGAQRGYKVIIVMPDTMSEERRKLMSAYGAELVLTDGRLGMKGAIEKANELTKEIPSAFIPSQFDNPANALAHYNTTGPEIWRDTGGNVDTFISGVGTGGTITGVGKFLKEKNPDIKIIAVEPTDSAVLSGKNAGAHKIQGIGAGFIPNVLERAVIDEIIPVSHEDAYKNGRLMGECEGILCGISAGAALTAAIEVSKRPENKGKNVVVILPDSGDRYLSTEMYN